MEPSRPSIPRRATSPPLRFIARLDWRVAAAAAAGALVLLTTGDVVLLVVLLGLAAGDWRVGAAAGLAAAGMAARWGTTSLSAIAGAQAVLGPGGTVGPVPAATALWLAGASLLAAASSPGVATAAALGLAAGLAVAGPSLTEAGDALVRIPAAVAGVLLALSLNRWVARPFVIVVAFALGAAAVVSAVLS